jgi:transcriptional regulator with XRE-family HTH domain
MIDDLLRFHGQLPALPAERADTQARPAAADAAPVRYLGQEIRALRKARRFTLATVAQASGLSVGYLSLLERDRSTPSINALHAISRALGVTVSWFFEAGAVPETERDLVVRSTRRRRLDYAPGISDELLSPSLAGSLELLLSRFQPGAASGDAAYAHDGEEAGVVLRGRLELWVDGKLLLLEAGDSFGFSSALPHRYRNPGTEEAVVIWAITPPSY